MSNSDAENLRLVLQYLRRTNRHDTCHRLERETQIFFDLAYFEGLVLAGALNEADWYLKGFTEPDENADSQKIFLSLYKLMFFEALDRSDTVKAVELLRKYLRPFEAADGENFTEMCRFIALDNFRFCQRKRICGNSFHFGYLCLIIWGTIGREHEGIKYLGDTAAIRREKCRLITEVIKVNPALKDKLEFPQTEPSSLRKLIDHDQNIIAPEPQIKKTPFTDHCRFPSISFPLPEPRAPIQPHGVQYSLDVLPTNVITTLLQGSLISTMDFNPARPAFLLVGTNTGEISVWDLTDLTARMRVLHRNFEIEDDLEASLMAIESGPAIAANRVKWDSNGMIFGVAFAKNIVHLYSYDNGRHNVVKKSEIIAHVGGVNDIAFSRPHGPLYVITCGDDRTIKVWNAESTSLVRTFEGHTAPVYSVLPHSRNGCHFILSSSMDGRRKVWLYDAHNSVVECPTLGNSFGTMAYNADGTRLFTCGIGDDGVAHAEQWNDQAGTLVRSYVGFGTQRNGVAQFDIANSRFLAVGEEHMIKFWDVDHADLLTSTKAGGGLPALPCIRFNKSGSLLVVSTNDNHFKVLANNDAQQLFVAGNQSNVVPGPSSKPKSKNRDSPTSRDAHNSVPEELNDGSSTRKTVKVQK